MCSVEWQYKRESISHGLIEKLNELGADGWEVISMKEHHIHCPEGGYQSTTVYLKRRVNELGE